MGVLSLSEKVTGFTLNLDWNMVATNLSIKCITVVIISDFCFSTHIKNMSKYYSISNNAV